MNLHDLDSVFNLTWRTSLRACVLIIVVLVVQTLAGERLPAQFRYALSFLVLLRLILLVTPACDWSVFNLSRRVLPSHEVGPILPSTASASESVALPPGRPAAAVSQPSRPSLLRLAAVFWCGGGTFFLLTVLWRRRKFALWVAQLPTATDPRLLELVEQCKVEAGVGRALRISISPRGSSAAVFGFYRPCLLLPDGMLDALERREARLVLLHELIHVRRHDVLVNWLSVLALALHWFNPLAWVAMRRLRADQELACDAVVLGLIEQAERGDYGRTLLKHLHDFPAVRMAVGLVPLITSRHNIKRRIIMITEFKHTGGWARGLFAGLLVALGGLTFTRAADEPKPASTNSALPPSAAASDPILTAGYDTNALEAFVDEQIQKTIRETYYGNRDRLIQSLREKGTTYEAWRRGQREYWIGRLMRELQATPPIQAAPPRAAANDAPGRIVMLTARLEDWDHRRVNAEADYLENSNVLFCLNNLPSDKLGGALTTAYAHQLDSELADFSERLQTAKARMVEVSNDYGADMPPFKTAKRQLEDAKTAYQDKIDAVMAGIRTRVSEEYGYLQLIQEKEDEIQKEIKEITEAHRVHF